MADINYIVKENTKMTPHSFYAAPVFKGTLSTPELLDEALDGKSVEPSVVEAGIKELVKTIQRNLKKGYRCKIGDWLVIYPVLQCSIKDKVDKDGNVIEAATADMVIPQRGRSRLGCTVSAKFSNEFEADVHWKKVGENSNTALSGEVSDGTEDDIVDTSTNANGGDDIPSGNG